MYIHVCTNNYRQIITLKQNNYTLFCTGTVFSQSVISIPKTSFGALETGIFAGEGLAADGRPGGVRAGLFVDGRVNHFGSWYRRLKWRTYITFAMYIALMKCVCVCVCVCVRVCVHVHVPLHSRQTLCRSTCKCSVKETSLQAAIAITHIQHIHNVRVF